VSWAVVPLVEGDFILMFPIEETAFEEINVDLCYPPIRQDWPK